MSCCLKSTAQDEHEPFPMSAQSGEHTSQTTTTTIQTIPQEQVNLKMLQYNESNTRNLWDQVFGQISETLGKGKNFQLAYPFIDWTWNRPAPGYIDPTAYTYLNQIPKWSATGDYDPSASGLFDSYFAMLLKCPKLTVTDEQRQQLKEIDDEIHRAQTSQTRDKQAMMTNWVQAQQVPPGIPPPEFEEWKQSSGWSSVLEANTMEVNKLSQTKKQIVAQHNAGYKEAIDKSTIPTDILASQKTGFLKTNISGNDEWRAGYIVSNGQDWQAQLSGGGGFSLEISLDASKSTHYIQESWAKGSANYGRIFFGAYSNGSWRDMHLSESDSSVKVTILIKAVTQVPVTPGVWYDGGYLATLATENQWNPPYTTQGGPGAVFGKGGLLPLRITGMVAGYQMSFKVTMHSSTFNRYRSMFEASGGFRIGPFHFGGSYRRSTDSWTKTAENDSFEGKTTANYPFIMGFTVATPGLS